MARKRSAEEAARRARVAYEELLKDREEDFDEHKAALLAAGDRDGLRLLSDSFGSWRREYKQKGEDLGYRTSTLRPGVSIRLSTDTWFHWGVIAFDAELAAHQAGAEYRATGGTSGTSDALGRAFRASSIGVVAASFMVEGLYGSVCYLTDVDGDKRWSIVMRTLRELFDLSRIPKLDQRMEELFGLRDNVAHPWVTTHPPQRHPYGFANTSVEVATYTPEQATECIDLACELLDQSSSRPVEGHRGARRWATQHREPVERLLLERQSVARLRAE